MAMSDKSLARVDELRKAVMEKIQGDAAACIAGLYRKPEDPDYNPDSPKTWTECSVKTRASLVIVKDAQAREVGGDSRPLGLVFGVVRMASKEEWEKLAGEVDEQERKRNAIDVAVGPAK